MAALAELCSWLSAPGNKLARLDLRDTMLSSDATDHPAQTEAAVSMLCAALASPHCVLEELNVQGFGFTAASVSRLAAPLLRPGCPLRKLHLARWPIPLGSLVDESGGLSFGGAAGCVADVVRVRFRVTVTVTVRVGVRVRANPNPNPNLGGRRPAAEHAALDGLLEGEG